MLIDANGYFMDEYLLCDVCALRGATAHRRLFLFRAEDMSKCAKSARVWWPVRVFVFFRLREISGRPNDGTDFVLTGRCAGEQAG